MEFAVLGPLVVAAGNGPVTIPAKQRAVLAALLLQANRVVSAEEIIEVLWDADPPAGARNTVQGYIKRLRRLLPEERVMTRPPGYLIEVREGELDLDRFAALREAGRAEADAGNWDKAAALLEQGLRLWRGEPLADVPSATLIRQEAPGLVEQRIQALDWRLEADLHCGRHDEVVPELRRLVSAHPLREQFWAKLMLALYRIGRQGDALKAFAEARSVLRTELGVEPGEELRRLHQQMLAADAALAGEHPGPQTAAVRKPGVSRPRQLPADVPDFSGRAVESATLSDLLLAQPAGHPGGGTVAVICGSGGVGKSALAVHVGHRVADGFPDGQLYAALGGSANPVRAADVLAMFLRDLGEPEASIPAAEAARAARYRSLLADRSMLVVLDDADCSAQVRPLLPGAGGSAAVVTSRGVLPELAGARQIELRGLGTDESRSLLAAMVGQKRCDADRGGTDAVLAACAGLPLAIRIAGARLAARPGWSITQLGGLLAGERRRLTELVAGDLAVRASFAVSYRALAAGDPAPAEVFRLLGVAGLPAIELPAVASLTGRPADLAAIALDALVDAHLLESPGPGQYRLHDLIRLYAAELAETGKGVTSDAAACRRLLTWYLRTLHASMSILDLPRDNLTLEPEAGAVPGLAFTAKHDAVAWLERERQNLTQLVKLARNNGEYRLCWQLAWLARFYSHWAGYWYDAVEIAQIGLAAATADGHRSAEAALLNGLGGAYWKLGQLEAARRAVERTLTLSQELGDLRGEARAQANLGLLEHRCGLVEQAIARFHWALAIDRKTGDLRGQALRLHNLGSTYLALGQPTVALENLEQALAIRQELDASGDEYDTLHSMGAALTELGRTTEAIECLEKALEICRDNGIRYGEGIALSALGDAYLASGRLTDAKMKWRHALDILAPLSAPEAEAVRKSLASPPRPRAHTFL
jgi:DNA-binding SARP family transcriptional activator/Tfp pilus assembly protein PilF